MHSNGINHRDYYICHFLLDVSADVLTMLYFSSMRIGLTWHDIYRFMSEYPLDDPGRWARAGCKTL